MVRLCRFILTIAVLAIIGLPSAPVEAKNIGADPRVRCGGGRTPCETDATGGAAGRCSSSERCTSGTCFSRTQGNVRETYHVVPVRSSTRALLDLSLTYDCACRSLATATSSMPVSRRRTTGGAKLGSVHGVCE